MPRHIPIPYLDLEVNGEIVATTLANGKGFLKLRMMVVDSEFEWTIYYRKIIIPPRQNNKMKWQWTKYMKNHHTGDNNKFLINKKQ